MKIGIVGYQGSGKSTLFQWLTGVTPDPATAHVGQSAMAAIPDPRVEQLCKIYNPKKITLASLELVDTPGLNRKHEGNAAKLGIIREAGCLILVVAGFGGADPKNDLAVFEEDCMLADMEIIMGRIGRLREGTRKPRPAKEKELEQAELTGLEAMLATLESGTPLRDIKMTDDQLKFTRGFRLLTEKPKLIMVNTADDESNPARFQEGLPPGQRLIAAPISLEVELDRMSEADRIEFVKEMGLTRCNKDEILRTVMDVSGQFLYFTAGDKEVRTWLLNKGGTALDAAANIHTDLARGFIRAEVMTCDDLIRLGSEREVKAAHAVRQEPKDYVVKDGDILHVKFSV